MNGLDEHARRRIAALASEIARAMPAGWRLICMIAVGADGDLRMITPGTAGSDVAGEILRLLDGAEVVE